ncbi:MAG: chloromuconate cycloisomerase, partial [Myxococcota bacterium]
MAPLIRAVETTVVDLPTIRPHRTKSDAIQRQSYVVVRLRTDDADGVGEAGPPGGPWWNGESAETCQAIIDRYLAPELVGMRVDQAPHVREKLGGR